MRNLMWGSQTKCVVNNTNMATLRNFDIISDKYNVVIICTNGNDAQGSRFHSFFPELIVK